MKKIELNTVRPYQGSELIDEFADPLPHDNICHYWEPYTNNVKEHEKAILSAVVCGKLEATIIDRLGNQIDKSVWHRINGAEMTYQGAHVTIMLESGHFWTWVNNTGQILDPSSPLNSWGRNAITNNKSEIVDDDQKKSRFNPPNSNPDQVALLICRKGNEFIDDKGVVPTALELKQYMCGTDYNDETIELLGKDLRICGQKILSHRSFIYRYKKYLTHLD